jgi:hypothetical protein
MLTTEIAREHTPRPMKTRVTVIPEIHNGGSREQPESLNQASKFTPAYSARQRNIVIIGYKLASYRCLG